LKGLNLEETAIKILILIDLTKSFNETVISVNMPVFEQLDREGKNAEV